ncbi:MAG: magnesium transporter, partial [Gammaproteobacteria bacterium]|nr:magnesium transporter [Gammaproteobacteria bacterium]
MTATLTPTIPENPLDAEERTALVLSLLSHDQDQELLEYLATMAVGEVASVIEGLPPSLRQELWNLIPEESHGELLTWLSDPVRNGLLKKMDQAEVITATRALGSQELADIIDDLSTSLGEAILESLEEDERSQVEKQLSYGEDTAGRLMRTKWVAVRADITLETVSRYLHMRGEMPPYTDGLMVVDREGRYEGKLPVDILLTMDSSLTVNEVMQHDTDYVCAEATTAEVTALFERRELLSLAVLDDNHHLIGRISIDDAMPLIRAEAEAPMMQMAGLHEDEDLFAPIIPSALRRMVWLAVNLATAFLASWVIGRFEGTLQQIVALAVLMPIVASMGGIAGSQTLTLAIRGLALGQITDTNSHWLAKKEIAIAAINGITWAVVVGVIVWLWFGSSGIALVLGAAMLINLLAAAFSGVVIPLLLQRFGIDPALSG